ncbi:MAG: tetratricopeptide repeat protein [Holophagales bacterium]|nr:tetratricopeptide repeat protein [Holophagales bacterium]
MRKTSIAMLALLLAAAMAMPSFGGWQEGVAAFQAQDFQTAAEQFQIEVDQNPSYQAHYMLGRSLLRLNRKEEALNHLRQAYDLKPGDLAVKMNLGQAYFVTRRYAEVEKLFSTIDPSSMPAKQQSAFYQMRAESKLKQGNNSGALSDLQQLARLDPKNADVHFKLAVVALKEDQLDSAIRAFDQAVRLDSGDAEKKRAYANALIKKGRMTNDKTAKRTAYLKASELAADVVAKNGSFDNLILQMSAQLGAGLYAEAVETGKKAEAKNSSDWIVPFYIGQAYTSDKKYSEAEAPLRKALQLARRPADQRKVWQQLGFAFEKEKRFAESIDAYQKAQDQASVARVSENQKIAIENENIEAQNAQIRAMEEEARRLEEELKQLESGGGGGGGR